MKEDASGAVEYAYRRSDGTVETASSAEDAMRRCPVLGKMALEQANVLLELAALGQEKVEAEAEEEILPVDEVTEESSLHIDDEADEELPVLTPASSAPVRPAVTNIDEPKEVFAPILVREDQRGHAIDNILQESGPAVPEKNNAAPETPSPTTQDTHDHIGPRIDFDGTSPAIETTPAAQTSNEVTPAVRASAHQASGVGVEAASAAEQSEAPTDTVPSAVTEKTGTQELAALDTVIGNSVPAKIEAASTIGDGTDQLTAAEQPAPRAMEPAGQQPPSPESPGLHEPPAPLSSELSEADPTTVDTDHDLEQIDNYADAAHEDEAAEPPLPSPPNTTTESTPDTIGSDDESGFEAEALQVYEYLVEQIQQELQPDIPGATEPGTPVLQEHAGADGFHEIAVPVIAADTEDQWPENREEPLSHQEPFAASAQAEQPSAGKVPAEEVHDFESIQASANGQDIDQTIAQLATLISGTGPKDAIDTAQAEETQEPPTEQPGLQTATSLLVEIDQLLTRPGHRQDKRIAPETLRIDPEIIEKLLLLLKAVGYEQPEAMLMKYISKHDLEFLLLTIRQLHSLLSEDGRQELSLGLPPAAPPVSRPVGARIGRIILRLAGTPNANEDELPEAFGSPVSSIA